jgi:hypothetical protein
VSAKKSALKATMAMTMNIRMGTTLAIVAILLMMAASLTPRRISSWNSQTPTDEQTTATTVSPAPSAGNSALVVVMMRTQYDVFPAHADAQKPNAELNPT